MIYIIDREYLMYNVTRMNETLMFAAFLCTAVTVALAISMLCGIGVDI